MLKLKFVLLIGFSAGKPPTNAKPQNVIANLKDDIRHGNINRFKYSCNLNWCILVDKTVISTLKAQLDTLNPFLDILKKFADPKEVEKILDNKLKLMEQETEIKRRQHITQTNEYLQKEWAKRFEIELKPKYDKTYKEFSDFAVLYFSQQNFSDKFERNAEIRMYFPTTADFLITYIDEVIEKPLDRDGNP